MHFDTPTQLKIYKVSELNFEIKFNLENSYSDIWVEGEISNFAYPNKKHIYFSLKDENSIIKVAFFDNSFRLSDNFFFRTNEIANMLRDGLHVYVNGYLSTYDKRSEYQIIARKIIPVKEGNLLIAFERLKEKLSNEGYFDEKHKKSIPILPEKIGLITSKSGAVIKDIIKILNKRFKNFHLILKNTPVQGNDAPLEIIKALDDLEEFGVDVIIIARGGGSFEDLAAFNDEELAKRIFKCKIPVISGVGHQTDFTICDFVADVRAATPTHAAELVILDKEEFLLEIAKNASKLKVLIKRKINSLKKELHFILQRKVILNPKTILNKKWQIHDDLLMKLYSNINAFIKNLKSNINLLKSKINIGLIKNKLKLLKSSLYIKSNFLKEDYKNLVNSKKGEVILIIERLKNLNPASLLQRGFSIAKESKTGKILKSINDIEVNSEMETTFIDGLIYSKVIKKFIK